MNDSLKIDFEQSMQNASGRRAMQAMSAVPTAEEVWRVNIPDILQMLIAKTKDGGRERRQQLTEAARGAVDALAELDLPWIPENVEGVIDDSTRSLGYAAIESILDAMLVRRDRADTENAGVKRWQQFGITY